jgi:hypothetical protein
MALALNSHNVFACSDSDEEDSSGSDPLPPSEVLKPCEVFVEEKEKILAYQENFMNLKKIGNDE